MNIQQNYPTDGPAVARIIRRCRVSPPAARLISELAGMPGPDAWGYSGAGLHQPAQNALAEQVRAR